MRASACSTTALSPGSRPTGAREDAAVNEGMSQLVISLPPALQGWVDTRLAQDGYADAAEYLRDLVRRDIASMSADRRWLKAMIDDGLASGVLDEDAEQVLDEIIAEDPDLRG